MSVLKSPSGSVLARIAFALPIQMAPRSGWFEVKTASMPVCRSKYPA
jgi:hypothetical protein